MDRKHPAPPSPDTSAQIQLAIALVSHHSSKCASYGTRCKWATQPHARPPAGYVAIIGKPNAGKSTLLNAILGQKLSIVTPKAQTTRHRIIGVHSGPEFQCILLDTPGILRPVSQSVRRQAPCSWQSRG